MKPVLSSLALSVLVSAVATAIARHFFQAAGNPPRPGDGARQGQFAPNIVIVLMPVLVGNSGNEFGVKHRRHGRHGPFRRHVGRRS